MTKPELKVLTSWDDGYAKDLELSQALIKYHLRSVFFIPTNCELDQDEICELAKYHEIGGHTISHPQDMKLLSDVDLKREINENKIYLERTIGKAITKFAYTRGRYDERVINAVQAAGYTYARTTVIGHTSCPLPFQQHTSTHVFPRKEYGAMHWSAQGMQMASAASETNTLFHLWGHTAEVERIGEWPALLKFLQWLSDNFIIIDQ